MGRGGRADAQHLSDGARAFRGVAPGQGMGAIHGPSHRNGRPLRRRESRREIRREPGRGVPRLGRVGRKARREAEQGACVCACWFESAPSPEEAPPRPLLFFLTHSSPPAPLYTQATLLFVRLLLSISQPSLHLHLSAFLSLSHQTIFFSPSSR